MMFEREMGDVADEFGIPVTLIRSICRKESFFNTWITRYEPDWKYYQNDILIIQNSRKSSTTVDTEKIHQATSFGLMQVMGSVARELGFDGQLTQLCHPEIGLHYGCKKLKSFMDKYGSLTDAVASYNAGNPFKSGTDYKNQQYVDDVMKYYYRYENGES